MENTETKKYDWKTHGDFKIYYDNRLKRHYWTLGYFGGGAINIEDAYDLAKDYSDRYNVPLNSVVIDEILKSRRHKYFKVIYSSIEHLPEQDAHKSDNVWEWLTD